MNFNWSKKLLFLYLVFFIAKNTYGQTPISGIINTYVKVTAVNTSCNGLTVTSPTGFNIGDRVLLIQMKGASVTNTNTNTFGTITAIGNAGNYEFNEIYDIQGAVIYLKYTFLKTYDPAGLQLITVPQYSDVLITGTLTATPWNGSIGGVLVFEASGNVEFNANINVEGLGFRGGAVSSGNSNSCSLGLTTVFATALGTDGYGVKGESISEYIPGREIAQNSQASGGGGGHASNTGGGGGSNYGKGGLGGRQSKPTTSLGCGATAGAQGKGGLALAPYSGAAKIFMGGGGGGGQQNNYGTGPGPSANAPGASPGNPGGGIVIIRAQNIIGNSYGIYAAGFNDRSLIRSTLGAYNPANNLKRAFGDSGGGGGGGGSILLSTSTGYTNALTVDVRGGRGDTVYTEVRIDLGPGGGGGAGIVWVNDATLNPNITAKITGGVSGISWNPDYLDVCQCPWLATNGDPGLVMNNLVLPQGSTIFTPCVAAPVSLLNFTGKENNNKITLNWSTASEISNDHFVLEKSNDGLQYEYLTSIKGAGNSSHATMYSFNDLLPLAGANYYRLKQYDFDGTEHIEGHVLVRFSGSGEIIEKIYPNPFTDEITIQSSSLLTNPEIKIVDLIGAEIYSSNPTGVFQNITINTNFLSKGVYFLQIICEGKIETRRIIKD